MRSVEVLSIVAISLFSLLGLFLVSKVAARQKGFGWLGIFFLLLALNFLDGTLLLNGAAIKTPYLAFWEDPLVLLYGPIVYFFSLRLKNGHIRWTLPMHIHLIPFLLLEIGVAIFHASTSVEQKQKLLAEIAIQPLDFKVWLVMMLLFAHLITYIISARRILSEHQRDLKQYYSAFEISWAFALLRMILIIFLSSLLITIVQYAGTREVFIILLFLLIGLCIFLTSKILLFALSQPIFDTSTSSEPSFTLPEEDQKTIKDQITHALQEQKLYTDPNLTLKDLSTSIGSSERAVSFVINHLLAENFYDLINDYRIREARDIMKTSTDSKLTVLEVLYQVGFNSKSSFNTQFKRKSGMTPTEFKRTLEK